MNKNRDQLNDQDNSSLVQSTDDSTKGETTYVKRLAHPQSMPSLSSISVFSSRVNYENDFIDTNTETTRIGTSKDNTHASGFNQEQFTSRP